LATLITLLATEFTGPMLRYPSWIGP